MKTPHYVIILFCILFSLSEAQAGWVKALVIDIEGDTLRGEVKAGKHSFSDFLKFRDEQGDKHVLNPEFYPEVITTDNHFKSIWFDREVAGYNTYCYGKLLTSGCIEVYDVNYPYRSCACKSQGTRRNHWVIKCNEQPLFIVYHNIFTNRIENTVDVQTFLRKQTEMSLAELKGLNDRDQLLQVLIRYNETCSQMNRTYRKDLL